jgi:hypothetical protein
VRIALLLLLAVHEIPVSHQAIDVKWERDRLLVLEPQAGKDASMLRVLDREGREMARIEPAIAKARRLEIRDFTLLPGGEIAVSVTFATSFGPDVSLVLMYDPASPAAPSRVADISPYICARIAPARDDGFWCLGYNLSRRVREQDYPLLVRFGADGLLRESRLQRSAFPHIEDVKEIAQEPFAESSIGRPQLIGGFTWLPNAGLLYRIDDPPRRWEVPTPQTGRSTVSVSVTASGRVLALFPLDPGLEKFTTPYGFFELYAPSGRWVRLAGMPAVPRGSLLVGADGEEVVVWDRSSRAVTWYGLSR